MFAPAVASGSTMLRHVAVAVDVSRIVSVYDYAFQLEKSPVRATGSMRAGINIGNKVGSQSVVYGWDLWHRGLENPVLRSRSLGARRACACFDVLAAAAHG